VALPSEFESKIKRRLEQIESAGLTRQLSEPSGVDLSSNDYLLLSKHPLVKARMAAAILDHGAGSTASRLLRVRQKPFEEVETRFARFKQSERSLYFGSGYAANLAVLSTFLEKGDLVFSDQLNHASLIDGIRLSKADKRIFPHCDVKALREMLGSAEGTGERFIVSESLFGMDGDKAPLRKYVDLCAETGAVLIVDEAHAVGLYGERGTGLIEQAGLDNAKIISINPAGKALGVGGAFVAGPAWAIEYLVQRARTFIFSTAPPPAMADALTASLDVIENEPERRLAVGQKSALFRQLLIENGFEVEQSDSPVIPVVIGDNEVTLAAAAELQALGYDIRAIRPPTVPEGTARLRISVNCGLTEEVIRSFVKSLTNVISTIESKSCSVASL